MVVPHGNRTVIKTAGATHYSRGDKGGRLEVISSDMSLKQQELSGKTECDRILIPFLLLTDYAIVSDSLPLQAKELGESLPSLVVCRKIKLSNLCKVVDT